MAFYMLREPVLSDGQPVGDSTKNEDTGLEHRSASILTHRKRRPHATTTHPKMPCDALARDILDPAVISGLDNGIFPLVIG
jgi:hypothetical protein